MTGSSRSAWWASALVALGVCLSDATARAEEHKGVAPDPGAGTTYAAHPTAESHREGEERDEEHDRRLRPRRPEEAGRFKLSIDLVLGFGKLDAVTVGVPSTARPLPPYTIASGNKVTSESFLLGLAVEPAPHFGIALRLPLTTGSIALPDGTSRSTSTAGNLELEGEYEAHLTHALRFIGALAVTQPTAQGTELPTPEDFAAISPRDVDRSAYDKFALNQAAARSRGYEENALFELARVGIIPRLALSFAASGFKLQPYLKLEALVSTEDHPDRKIIGELVGGVRAAYAVIDPLEIGVRTWFNMDVKDTGRTVAVVEPELRGYLGPVRPVLGVLLPYAGKTLTSPSYLGVRLGVGFWF